MSVKHYKFLGKVFVKIRHIGDTIRVLHRTKLDVDDKLERIYTLQEVVQEILDSDVIADAMASALASKGQLGDWDVANLHCMNRLYKSLKGIPLELSNSLIRAKLLCRNKWESFRNGDAPVRDVMDCLACVVKLSIELAAAKSRDLGVSSKYDVMLGIHDGDLNTKKMDEMFTDMGAFFRQFCGEVLEKQSSSKVHVAKAVAGEKQCALHQHLAGAMHAELFGDLRSLEGGESCWDPLRAVSCDELDYRIGLQTLMENVGKVLYQANLPKKWRFQPVGNYPGVLMYEAQGLLMSQQLLRCREFITFMLPAMRKFLSLRARIADVDNVYTYLTEVRHSVLLEMSGEVTFLAHGMLRYALEKEMINDGLQVEDLHDAWVQGMKHYFDIVPTDEKDGFLQDCYWVSGDFGYVPCMAVASIIAAQLFSAMSSNEGNVLAPVERGDFSGVLAWLNENVYSYGGRYSSTMLLKKVTGRKIDVDSYKNYLIGRYLSM